jgi:arylsulfatase A-like enzyme
MPTLLDAAGAEIPEGVEGRSILDLLRDPDGSPTPAWRERLHGEICQMGGEQSGMQYLTDGKRKYIWEPAHDRELFFDLENDPDETVNLAENPDWAETIADWRQDLIQRLEGREEGFVKDGKLVKLDGPTRVAFDHLIEQGVPLWRPK